MQGFSRTRTGKILFDFNLVLHQDVEGAFYSQDTTHLMAGFLIGGAQAPDGTPDDWFTLWNPFRTDVQPATNEAYKNPFLDIPRVITRKLFRMRKGTAHINDLISSGDRGIAELAFNWRGKVKPLTIKGQECLYFWYSAWHAINAGQSIVDWELKLSVPVRHLT